MSKTFTSRPACQTNTRGTSRGTSQNEDRHRGPSNRGRGLSKVSTTVTTRPRNRNMSAFPGAGHSISENTYSRQYNNVGSRTRVPQNTAAPEQTAAPQQEDQSRRGSYAGGFTVFSPNEKKRQEIAQMAQREAQAYEQYKEANAVRHVSHIGAVGGGELSEDQVRIRQANAIKAGKFNKLKKQQEQRQAKKDAEDLEIERMRAEARKKTERNEAREARYASPEEVRRNREAFLQQLENKSSMETAPSLSNPAGPARRLATQTSSHGSVSHTRPPGGTVFHAPSNLPTTTTRTLPKKTLGNPWNNQPR